MICVHVPSWWQWWRQSVVHFTLASDHNRIWQLPLENLKQFAQVTPFGESATVAYCEMYGQRMVVKS